MPKKKVAFLVEITVEREVPPVPNLWAEGAAVADHLFETYNADDSLVRVTWYGDTGRRSTETRDV
jgi:hypothetical protein